MLDKLPGVIQDKIMEHKKESEAAMKIQSFYRRSKYARGDKFSDLKSLEGWGVTSCKSFVNEKFLVTNPDPW